VSKLEAGAVDVAAVLDALDAGPSPAAYLRAARELAALADPAPAMHVGLVASFTIEPLLPYLAVELARRGRRLRPYVAPFDSVVAELVGDDRGVTRHGSDAVVVAQQLDDVAPDLARGFPGLGPAAVAARIDQVAGELAQAVQAFRRRSHAAVLVLGFVPPPGTGVATGAATLASGQAEAVRRLNATLAAAVAAVPDVEFIDFERLVAEVGTRAWWNPSAWYTARAPLNAPVLPPLARRLAARLAAVGTAPRKCLVLDLDDTLWGGIVGEAGPAGIDVGAGYPGNVHRDLQWMVRGLRDVGVLLAINSKNNRGDVEAAFAHPGMILRLDDFAAARINWAAKPDNMRELARELGIGLDSLVFLDDNPAEREQMRLTLPEVLTLDVRRHPLGLLEALDACDAFERRAITVEDRERSASYATQVERRRLEAEAVTVDDFLARLEQQVTIEPATEATRPRVVDLLAKTNQFNLTTRRHSAAQVAELMADPACGVFTARVRDRLGDNGLVGVAVVRRDGDTAAIDSLVLSCRVIGRRIDSVLLAFVADWARRHGARRLVGEFIATARNEPAADCYPRHGFVASPGDGPGRWSRDLETEGAIVAPDYIAVTVGQ